MIESESFNPLFNLTSGTLATPVALGFDAVPGIASGAYLNNRICFTSGQNAYVSQHIGDLDNRETCGNFASAFAALPALLHVEPQWIATDLHPDFYSTRIAHAYAATNNLPCIEVQHHHAHIGAVIAEHQLSGSAFQPILGLALDGFGLGSDGAAWGGELLLLDGAQFERIGHLHALPLPGGDRAAREPWRMAAAALYDLGRRDEIVARFGASSVMIATMIAKGLNAPRTSSAGRLFDAAAGMLGIMPVASFEAEAAILLEKLAASFGDVEPMAASYSIDHMTLNMLPLLAHMSNMRDAAHAAALFHASFAAALGDWVLRAAELHGIDSVALGGGCFHNRILSKLLREQLTTQKMKVFEAVQVSPGDGGLSLGQAWVALQTLR